MSQNLNYVKQQGAVNPISLFAKWLTARAAGEVASQDAATITNPEVSIASYETKIIKLGQQGTNLILRLAYDDGLTAITNPIVKVFGRTGSDAWQLLLNKAGGVTTTLTTSANDTTDGTLLYTIPDFTTQAIDCLGCDELLVGVETALAGTGTVSNAIVQAKVI